MDGNDFYNVGNDFYNVMERDPEPITFEELRERLKTVACLCVGLCIDLQNDIELRDRLNTKINLLEYRLKEFKKRYFKLQKSYYSLRWYYRKKLGKE